MYQQYRPNLLPTAVKAILIICVVMFVGTELLKHLMNIDLADHLALFYFKSDLFRPWQVVTHIFMHGNLTHLLFNMLAFWMFGMTLENLWGTKRFLIYFFVTGIGAAVIHTIVNHIQFVDFRKYVNPEDVELIIRDGADYLINSGNASNYNYVGMYKLLFTGTVGASGAVFGILLAFGMLFPNTEILLYFLFPIKAKYFVMIYGAIELFLGIQNNPGDNIAHFAHLGGMLFGFFLIRYWNSNNRRTLY